MNSGTMAAIWQAVSNLALIIGLLLSAFSLRGTLADQQRGKEKSIEEAAQNALDILHAIDNLSKAVADQKTLLHDINLKLDDHNVRLARLETEVFRHTTKAD